MIAVSIIIVSFNTKDILQKCLSSIENSHIQSSYEVIVVDNNSSDGSKEMIKKEFKKILLIENKENMGFSKANNIGVKKAQGEYILFLNSDTIVFKNSVDDIVSFLDKNENVGAATCRVELVSGEIDDASHRGFPTPWNSFAHFSGLSKVFSKIPFFSGYNKAWMDLHTTHEIDALAGAYMMVKRQVGEKVGWWDEDYFWYGDDLDFCYRIKKNGWKIYYVPTAKILHYKGVSGGLKDISKGITTADISTKRLASNARFEAMKIFYKKHYEKKYPFLITWLVYRGIDLKKRINGV